MESTLPFYSKEHIHFLMALENSTDLYAIGKYLTEHLKMPGGYWSINALYCLKEYLPQDKIDKLTLWIKSCQNTDGGFGGNLGHDSHITATHYALLVLFIFDRVS